MRVSIVMGVPKKWMGLEGKIPLKWMITRGTPISGNHHMDHDAQIVIIVCSSSTMECFTVQSIVWFQAPNNHPPIGPPQVCFDPLMVAGGVFSRGL